MEQVPTEEVLTEEEIKNSQEYRNYVAKFVEYMCYDQQTNGSIEDSEAIKIIINNVDSPEFYKNYQKIVSNYNYGISQKTRKEEIIKIQSELFNNDYKVKLYLLIYIKQLVLEDFNKKIEELNAEKTKLENNIIFDDYNKIYVKFFIIQDIEEYIKAYNIKDNTANKAFRYDKKYIEECIRDYSTKNKVDRQLIDNIIYLYINNIINYNTHSKIIIEIYNEVKKELEHIITEFKNFYINKELLQNSENTIHEYKKKFNDLYSIINKRMLDKFIIMKNKDITKKQEQKKQEQKTASNLSSGLNPLNSLNSLKNLGNMFKSKGGKKKYSCRRRVKKNTQKGKKKIKKTQKKN
jgi:hypothetical protein